MCARAIQTKCSHVTSSIKLQLVKVVIRW